MHKLKLDADAVNMLDKMDAVWMDSLDGLNGRGAVLKAATMSTV